MKFIVKLLLTVLSVNTWLAQAQAQAQTEPCGYESQKKLMAAADQVIQELQTLSLPAETQSPMPDHPIFAKIKAHPSLQILARAGALKAQMEPLGSQQIYPAYSLNTKTVKIPQSWMDFKREELGPGFDAMFSMVMWHEFGHTVYERVLEKNPKLARKLGDPETMKGHVLVDGIALRLMNISTNDFAELMGLASYGGYFTFDIAERQACLLRLKN